MSAIEKKKILWSPHNSSQFATAGNDLRIYQVKDTNAFDADSEDFYQIFEPDEIIKQKGGKVVSLISAQTEVHPIKCFDWNYDTNNPYLLSLGLYNGSVLLVDIEKGFEKIKKQFFAKSSRICNAIAWNPAFKNLLAAGFDKARPDFSLMIWDINERGSTLNAVVNETSFVNKNTFDLSPIVATERVESAKNQFANSESILSVAWLPNSPYNIATGTDSRWLRIYDIRNHQNKPVVSIGAHVKKGVVGVSFDPFYSNRLATFSIDEPVIKLWDIRQLEKSFAQIETNKKKIIQISWCRTRGGLLGSISEDENFIRVWDLNNLVSDCAINDKKMVFSSSFTTGSDRSANASLVGETRTISIVHHKDSYPVSENVVDFAWNPNKDQLLSIGSNSVVEIISIHKPVPICFDNLSRIGIGIGKNIVEGPVLSNRAPTTSDPQQELPSQPINTFPTSNSNKMNNSSNNNNNSTIDDINNFNHSNAIKINGNNSTTQTDTISNISKPNGNNSGGKKLQFSVDISKINSEKIEESNLLVEGDGKDISVVMNQRAIKGYGGDAKFNHSLSRIFKNKAIHFTWSWLCQVKYSFPERTPVEFKGIHTIMNQEKINAKHNNTSSSINKEYSTNENSLQTNISLNQNDRVANISGNIVFSSGTENVMQKFNSYLPSNSANSHSYFSSSNHIKDLSDIKLNFPIYNSQQRQHCMSICGWNFNDFKSLQSHTIDLAEKLQVSRATAISVFYLEIAWASSILRKYTGSSDVDLKLLELALAGFGSPKAEWKASLDSLKTQLKDPYLLAILSFLSCVGEPDFSELLLDSGMDLADSIAFACRYLEDEKLLVLLETLRGRSISKGDLNGLILTGIDSIGGGVELLQNYLNNSGDIQTVALLVCHVSQKEIKDPLNRINNWIDIYRQLLDCWELWMERARLDVFRGSLFEIKPPPQVIARCNYCNNSFTLGRESIPIKMSVIGDLSTAATQINIPNMHNKKTSACPSCKNSLPKCALCLLPLRLSIPHTIENRVQTDGLEWNSGVQSFDEWFAWCQTCEHGGHAKHMLDWFEYHKICPVSDCDCNCSFMRNPIRYKNQK